MKNKILRRYLLAGLLVWLPILATLVVIRFILTLLDTSLSFLPEAYQPEHLIGYKLPGLGVVLSLFILFLTGMITTNVAGRYLVNVGERILARIPLVRSIYHAVKQVLETLFSNSSRSFRHVVLVEYPRKGLWSIAFETGEVMKDIKEKTGKEEMLTIFIPTTPNPTSGFLIMVPHEDVITLDISIEDALKLVISLGVVQNKNRVQQNTTATSEEI